MCSYGFVNPAQKPCYVVCNILYTGVSDCENSTSFSYTFNNIDGGDANYKVFPDNDECTAIGAPGSDDCTAVIFSNLDLGWQNRKIIPPSNFQLRPGGATKGSVLGFGVLLGLLLVIASLGFIMKHQSKK
ncbi:expressed protein [Dictyostelium purpureum]|uniref:Expressed protein n=1 Tax=Dictyostelium purpureum TaxID=5786 RepID=F0Z6S9_DICPU|nr:uncharacterized protein DICPUDRAFT_91034 [Dictyostelium purpureum]EGC40317.1 expressed protein [Dictyostelium purpureum]|eukprot:XP_003283068.1 expressed protein [Dictyostelium purpureum]